MYVEVESERMGGDGGKAEMNNSSIDRSAGSHMPNNGE
jgi:hypothetical protein